MRKPREIRPLRLAQKQRAGATAAVLNHASSTSRVASFLDAAARTQDATLPVVAAVAVYTDERCAPVAGLPRLRLDPDRMEAVLAARDPVEAGIEAAVAEASELLSVVGVAGVNLSGRDTTLGVEASAEVKAEIGRRIHEIIASQGLLRRGDGQRYW